MEKIQSKCRSLSVHNIIHQLFRHERADNSGVSGGIWQKFKLIQAFMHVLVTCKNEDDRIKTERARVFTKFLPLYVYRDFSRRSRAAYSAVLGQIWPKFEHVRDIMIVLVTCKYEEGPIKNEGASVFTTFPHCHPMGAIRCHGHHSSDQIWSKPYASFPPINDALVRIWLQLTHWSQKYS